MTLYPSLSLSDLPLRPSTLTLLHQRGFVTLAELMESKNAGLDTLASELQMDSTKVMRLLHEIQDCLTASSATTAYDAVKGPQQDASVEGLAGNENDASVQNRYTTPTGNSNSNSNSNAFHNSNNSNVPQLIVTPPPMLTASDILSKASLEKGGIITFCKSLDQLLHRSGIPIGSLTEIAGLPGLGKTQFAMQLAVNARLPTILGGVQGQTIYIDAEGSVAPERLESMANALLQHCQHTLHKRGMELPRDFKESSQILQDIHVFRVLDEAAQTATLYSLPYWIEQLSSNNHENQNVPVKLIVVDSIAFHYRCSTGKGHDYYQERSRSLTRLAAFLNDLARDYNVAVVCLNQMTTKMVDGHSFLVPALGESWAHAVTTRLLLSCDTTSTDNHRRLCRLVKSPCMPAGTSYYQINGLGIRDAQLPPTTSSKNSRTPPDCDDDDDSNLVLSAERALHESQVSRSDRISFNPNKRPRTTS